MTLVATILGCGSSAGVPRPALGWGACDPANPRNRRRRCSMLVERTGPRGRTRVLVDKDADSLALGGGVGADVFFSDNAFLGMEFRFAWLAGLETDATFAVQNAGFTERDSNGVVQGNLLLRVGVTF